MKEQEKGKFFSNLISCYKQSDCHKSFKISFAHCWLCLREYFYFRKDNAWKIDVMLILGANALIVYVTCDLTAT